MGNVVSSLVMYALQAAWFCQRLIDQDYRENHGSRSKPVMGIHETDLDVFLSKCRSYYLSKRNRHRTIKYEEEEPNGKLNHVNRDGNLSLDGSELGNSLRIKGADSLHFDYDNFLSRTDQRVSLSEPDFSRLTIDKNDLGYFLSKSSDLSRSHRKSDSPKTERRKRKKVYYRKRYNPRGGDRGNEAGLSMTTAYNSDRFLTSDVDDTDLGSSCFTPTRFVSQRKRERLSLRNLPSEHPKTRDVEYPPPDHSHFPESLESATPTDSVWDVKNADSDYFRPGCGAGVDRVLSGMNRNVVEVMMVRECLTGSSSFHDF